MPEQDAEASDELVGLWAQTEKEEREARESAITRLMETYENDRAKLDEDIEATYQEWQSLPKPENPDWDSMSEEDKARLEVLTEVSSREYLLGEVKKRLG